MPQGLIGASLDARRAERRHPSAESDLPEAFLRFIRALAEADEAEDYARRAAQLQARDEMLKAS